jgi:Mg2+ and Co2+ transporter CorA
MPLSFLASVFGMNVAELNGGTLTFREEFTYMCKSLCAEILDAGLILSVQFRFPLDSA